MIKVSRDELMELLMFLKFDCKCNKPERLKHNIEVIESKIEEHDKAELKRKLYKLYKEADNEKDKKAFLEMYLEQK